MDKPGQHPRELNPFWKDGGAGLPSAAGETATDPPPTSCQSTKRAAVSLGSRKTVGDGGRSWLLRAYKRALEQASEGDRSLEEIAIERWGSLEKLHTLLSVAGIDPSDPDAPPKGRGKREYLYSRARRLDHGSERRAVEEFDQRRERDRERRERDTERGRREWDDRDRRGEGYSRERGGEDRRSEFNRRRHRADIDERKRDWKQRRPLKSSESNGSSEFLKPGEFDQGPHSRSTGIRAGLTAPTSSGQGWRKRQEQSHTVSHSTAVTADTTALLSQPFPAEDETNSDELSPPSQIEPSDEPPFLPTTREHSEAGEKSREPAVTVPEEPVTEAKLNSLGAKLMKAELMGNQEKIDKLKNELQRLREVKRLQESAAEQPSSGPSVARREERTLVLTKTDRFGREKPVESPSSSLGYRPPARGASTHSKKGKREKYFHDDDRYSLRELVEQERMMTAEETHAAIARMASKFVPAAGSDETVDDAFDSKSATKYNEAKELDKAKKRSIAESRKMADAVDKCQFCFDNPNFNKHLLVAVGMNTYLCAPWHTSLTDGHCYIVPMEHVTCSLFLDENVWSEIEIFRKGLTRMFADHDFDVVFMETFTSVKRRTHMYIDCIPLPREEGSLAPMYFKKAILESDEEWAQNKKLVDTKEKGVRGSLPTGLPYFFAEFGTDGGFGHVIEDTDQFPHYFGREVVGGLLDLDPRLWLKPRREDFDKQKAKVTKLSEWWTPYDWTQKLKT